MSKSKFSRRAFLGGAIGLAAATPFNVKGLLLEDDQQTVGYRQRVPNPWLENSKPVVAIVRGAAFATMLAKGLELLGGLAPFGTEKAVLVKPNFIFPEPYPETTDGASILTMVETLKREGFSDIIVADQGSRRRPASQAFEFYSLGEKSKAGAFKIKDLAGEDFKIVKDDNWLAMQEVEVFDSAYNAPLIVNMPVIKQHHSAQFTCALKNNVGPISNRSRSFLHRQNERYKVSAETRIQNMKKAIAEVTAAINPEITVIDARQVMGKSHHRSSGGVVVDANRLIISGDALAADRVAATVLDESCNEFQVSMTDECFSHAATLGLGVASLEDAVIKEATV